MGTEDNKNTLKGLGFFGITRRAVENHKNAVAADTEAPTVGSRVLRVTSVTPTSLSIEWEKAQDNVTGENVIRYEVAITEADNPRDPWRKVADGPNITSYTFTGLKPNTTYGYYVKAYDEKGNKLQYPVDNGCSTHKTAASSQSSSNQATNTSISQPSTGNRMDDINLGLLRYSRTNAEHDILVKMAEKKTECKFVEVNGGICHIKNKSVNIDETPKGDLFPENDINIFPGAIVYADEFLAKGTPRLVNFGKQDNYGSIILSTDFDNGGKIKEKVKISASAAKEGIAKLLRRAYDSGYQPSGQLVPFEETYSDVNKMAIEANCSVDFLVKCNVKTNSKQDTEKVYKAKRLTQQFYKISAEIENGNKASVFGPDVTWNDVQEAMKEAPIAIIMEVTYGRYGYFFSEYESSHFNFVGSQDISYKSNKIDLKQDIDRLTKSTKKWGYVYGGSANTAAKAVANEDDFITQMNSTPNVGPTNQGRPISYTVVFLSSDKPCKKFNTGSYYEPTYTFLPKRIQTWIHNGAKVVACTKLFVDMWYKTCYIHPTTKEIIFNNDNNGDGIKWNHGFKERGLHEEAITLRDGLFFQPEAHIRITHQHAAGASWNVTSDGYVDISNGKLTLEIGGSGYAGQRDPYFVEEEGKQTLI